MSQADEDYEQDQENATSQRIRDCAEREMESDGRIIDYLRRQLSEERAKSEAEEAEIVGLKAELAAERTAHKCTEIDRLRKSEAAIRADERAKVWEEAAKVVEGGRFLHDGSPEARWGRECAAAVRRAGAKSPAPSAKPKPEPKGETK